MKIAHIHAFSRDGNDLEFYVDYLEIVEEHEDSYTLEDNDNGISPRGDWISKEIDLEAADDGYASLYLPGWVKVDAYETSGMVYVLEHEIEKGKEILKETFIKNIDKQLKKLEKMKEKISVSK